MGRAPCRCRGRAYPAPAPVTVTVTVTVTVMVTLSNAFLSPASAPVTGRGKASSGIQSPASVLRAGTVWHAFQNRHHPLVKVIVRPACRARVVALGKWASTQKSFSDALNTMYAYRIHPQILRKVAPAIQSHSDRKREAQACRMCSFFRQGVGSSCVNRNPLVATPLWRLLAADFREEEDVGLGTLPRDVEQSWGAFVWRVFCK